VHQSASRLTRKRLLLAAGGTAGSALALAALTPVLSAGPILDTDRLRRTPWRRGRRLVRRTARRWPRPTSRTAASTRPIPRARTATRSARRSSSCASTREPAAAAGRRGWAPQGILAYSKVCTHAGLRDRAVPQAALPAGPAAARARVPLPLLDVRSGHGRHRHLRPAGRPLPQLPCWSIRRATCAPPARSRAGRPVVGRRAPGAHGMSARAGSDDAVRFVDERTSAAPLLRGCCATVPRPLVVPARRGRALRVRRARGHGVYLTLFFEPSLSTTVYREATGHCRGCR
jgi:hypothetical protein